MVIVMTRHLVLLRGLVRAKNTLKYHDDELRRTRWSESRWSFIGYTLAFSTGSSGVGGFDNAS